ncbi:MAG: hypothetical protein K0Q83_620, partial [Deltaproteobacteria bacterium]|nr:hypothetical protein [Deltaproteobacteria bacterium]
ADQLCYEGRNSIRFTFHSSDFKTYVLSLNISKLPQPLTEGFNALALGNGGTLEKPLFWEPFLPAALPLRVLPRRHRQSAQEQFSCADFYRCWR